ncbi:hypothetical protein V1512DRAFT_276358 [Lipomyces arxii]|uniref:uncharacterized protein n=1 Tax=Lipomyces arxii TaxID=56418 RepID=UPI0034CD7E1B
MSGPTPSPTADTHSRRLTESNEGESPSSANSKQKKTNDGEIVRRRTRTGCLTCRKRYCIFAPIPPVLLDAFTYNYRRIKCDEAKPKCQNCMKSRRVCEGYGARTEYQAAYFNTKNPPIIEYGQYPHYINYGPYVQSNQLYAASNYYTTTAAAAAAAATVNNSYIDQAMVYTPIPYASVPAPQLGWVTPRSQISMQQPAMFDYLQDDQVYLPELMLSEPSIVKQNDSDQLVLECIVNSLSSSPSLSPPFLAVSSSIDGTKSPLMHADAQRMFRHFIHVISYEISLYERFKPAPHQDVIGATEIGTTNIWSYDIPVMALSSRPLLHAILALSALHLSTVIGVSAESAMPYHQASLLHYHLALRRLAKTLQERRAEETAELSNFAASLILAFYETTTGEHDNLARHLQGTSNLMQGFDMHMFADDYRINLSDPTIKVESVAERADVNMKKLRRTNAMVRLDLKYFYLRMDVMHSISAGVRPYLACKFWDNLPVRYSDRGIECWDTMLKSAIVLADWVVRESARKRTTFFKPSAEETSLAEWNTIHRQLVEAQEGFSQRFVAEFIPDNGIFSGTIKHQTVLVAVIDLYHQMLHILLLRNRPIWAPEPAFKGGLRNVFVPEILKHTAPICEHIGQCIQRL